MIRPNIEEGKQLCKSHTVIPICLELFSDIKTPIAVLKTLKEKSKQCYLLESVEGGEKWGRYSFLGFEPKLSITCNHGKTTLYKENKVEVYDEPPKKVIRQILEGYKTPKFDFLPSFTGGFVGYISYEYAKYAEKNLHLDNYNPNEFDDLHLMLFDEIIAFDHLRQKIMVIVNVKTEGFEKNYVEGILRLKEIEKMIQGETPKGKTESKLLSDFRPLFTKEQYCERVEKVKHHIYEGDIFQAVMANPLEADFQGDLLSTYRVLRTMNPSPYMFYMDFDGMQVAGASPETLISLKDNTLSTFPIAGTCPRGKTPEEDQFLIDHMLNDEKELAEHHMLVDLARNDLGKVSEFGSVTIEDYKQVLRFSHVSHIATTVKGRLKEGLDQIDAIDAVLPAGTLSGAPKHRAMEIIRDMEPSKRGVYGGGIGYIDFSGNMDLCIAIRMAVAKGGKVHVASGAGIVADSVPEKEYNECLSKSKVMRYALEQAEEVE